MEVVDKSTWVRILKTLKNEDFMENYFDHKYHIKSSKVFQKYAIISTGIFDDCGRAFLHNVWRNEVNDET